MSPRNLFSYFIQSKTCASCRIVLHSITVYWCPLLSMSLPSPPVVVGLSIPPFHPCDIWWISNHSMYSTIVGYLCVTYSTWSILCSDRSQAKQRVFPLSCHSDTVLATLDILTIIFIWRTSPNNFPLFTPYLTLVAMARFFHVMSLPQVTLNLVA
jgi:hypothetical protein